MLWQNLRFAWRSMIANPGYAIAAILALAIGIGLNTAMFSVVDGILLKPLPFDRPDRLVSLREEVVRGTTSKYPFAAGNLYDYVALSKTTDVIAYGLSPFSLILPNSDPERYFGATVSEGWFKTYGVKMIRGRDFRPDDYLPGRDDAVILSGGLWRDRFASAEDIVGREINLNGRKRTVAGVVDPEFEYPTRAKIWAPLVLTGEGRTRRDFHAYLAQGRLRPGVTIEQARAEFTSMLSNLTAQYPEFNKDKRVSVEPLEEELTGRVKPALFTLIGAVAFVLAIACANVANLLLARGAVRKPELAVRASLGATRSNLIGQLLTESFLLATLGGLAGLGLAYAAFYAFKNFAPQNLPRVDRVVLDARVLIYNFGAVLLTGTLFGLLPAIRMSKIDLHTSLKAKTRGGSGRANFRDLLVVCQVAAALILMTGAGLLIRSLYQLSQVDLGFNPEHVLTMRVTPLPSKYNGEIPRQIQFGQKIVRNLESLPGVKFAALSTDLPLQGNPRFIMRIEGAPPVTAATAPVTDYYTVTPAYFEAMGIPLKNGRTFRASDNPDAPTVVIVNEQFAKTHYQGANPIGKRMEIGINNPPEWRQIVGVAKDVKNTGIDKGVRSQVYAPFFQAPGIIQTLAPSFSVISRTEGNPAQMAQSIRARVLEADNAQPVWQIQTLKTTVNNSISRERFTLFLMSIFAGVAFLLAIIGLSGVMSYTVAQRTREIGIRLAIGAKPRDVLWMIERHALLLVTAGIAGGAIGSILIAKTMTALLFEVSPNDPLTFASIAVIFLATALLSGLIPARRAASIDPAITLRAD